MAPWGSVRQPTAPRCLGLLAAAALAACSPARPDADRLELATIPRWKEIPKSSPAQLVGAFDRFCVNRPADMAGTDAALRRAGYVPRQRAGDGRMAVYVVDDLRPAVVIGPRLCGVRAISRTGQTERVNRYVAETFPSARPAPAGRLGRDVEQAWVIPGGMLATTRNDWIGNRAAYTIVLFTPDPTDP